MSGRTKIEWTERTWNPTRGCSMAEGSNSPECGGCYNCYAARQALRMAGPGGAYEGLVKLTPHGPRWTGKVVLAQNQLDAPLRVKQPAMWFVNSMSDLFHESLDFKTIARIIRVMQDANWHTYQVLTKRAKRLREFSEWYAMQYTDKLPRHIWFGISAETQETLDVRVGPLLDALLTGPRFVSLEPLLRPVLIDADWLYVRCKYCGRHSHRTVGGRCEYLDCTAPYFDERLLNWVIIGGESGPGARPFDLAWAKRIIEQCKEAGVPVFMKQLGARPKMYWWDGNPPDSERPMMTLKDRKGADPSEWPEWARVREFPK